MANPNLLLAKAWDNRLGCALAAEVALALKGQKHPNRLFAVATVQEEVGLRGAQTSAFKVQPDVAIALDSGIAHDTPGTEGDEKLGRRAPKIVGPLLTAGGMGSATFPLLVGLVSRRTGSLRSGRLARSNLRGSMINRSSRCRAAGCKASCCRATWYKV